MDLRPGTPILWRGDALHQVGVGRAVRVGAAEAEALSAAAPEGLARHADLRARLARAGLIATEGGAAPRVRVRGLSGAGVAAAEALARAGAALSLVDPTVDDARTEEAGALPALARGTRAARASRLLRDLRPGAPCDLEESRTVDAEVAVAVATLPPTVLHGLMVTGTPHAAVLVDESGVTVIAVLPGVSACVRCRDLALTRGDAAWPMLARQCETLAPVTDARSAAVAGAIAAAAVLAMVEGEPAPGAWRIEHGIPRRVEVEREPECGCADAPGA